MKTDGTIAIERNVPLRMVDRAFLKRERLLTEAYIKRHGRDMGGIGKPMIWDLELVDLFLREQTWKGRLAREAAEERGRDLKAEIDRIIRRATVTPIGAVREIRGRGGRGRAA